MDLQWNDEQQELRDGFAEFGRREVAARADACYRSARFDQESWQALADTGFWRLPVPVEFGGAGRSWWEFAAALEGLSSTSTDLGFLLSIVAHSGIIRGLVDFGSEAQRERWLERLMSGAVGATAMTEDTGGSDVARVATKATAVDGGYFLTGAKRHITNAPVADIALVLARIPELGASDITVFIVERGQPGLNAGEPEVMFGNPTSPTGPLDFHEVFIDTNGVMGTPGDGLQTIYRVIAMDRLLYGIIAAAFIEPILAETLLYARNRDAFKAPIADHQYIQGRLTDLRITSDTVRAVSYTALDQLLSGHPAASATCSVAKMLACEGLCQATQHAMAIFGHRGYMLGPITRAAADALGTRIAGGTSEMQRKNIFNQLLRLHDAKEVSPWLTSDLSLA
ncbi:MULTISPECIES: acyl-CoA dehydrogenase family protein [unclassified Frankia]|uniref:acyl-CoA dehydrogenase family protein n=1 Tax=unclassified Frankia TaxID=2632575 RepID=UPI002024A754